jgi:predicted amidohydrolase YtcJ
MGPLKDVIFPPGNSEKAIRLHADDSVTVGVTTAVDMAWGLFDFDGEWAVQDKLANDPSFPVRVSMVPYEPNLSNKFGDERFAYLDKMRARNTDRLQIHGIKFQMDGSYPATTSMIGYPGYLDEDTGATGDTKWEDTVEWYWPYWERGIRIHSHANGDATLEMTLDALAELQNRKPRFDHRFTIEHYTISNPEQAYRLAALGGAASVNGYFPHYRALLHSNYAYGPDRAEATARLGSLARAGARFAIHADFNMVVVPMKPLEGAWIAVNRLAEDDKTVVAPGERISVEQALRAITIDGAWMIDREKDLGSLEPGKLADMAILAEDPLEVDPMKLRDIEVLDTISGGVVHKAS